MHREQLLGYQDKRAIKGASLLYSWFDSLEIPYEKGDLNGGLALVCGGVQVFVTQPVISPAGDFILVNLDLLLSSEQDAIEASLHEITEACGWGKPVVAMGDSGGRATYQDDFEGLYLKHREMARVPVGKKLSRETYAYYEPTILRVARKFYHDNMRLATAVGFDEGDFANMCRYWLVSICHQHGMPNFAFVKAYLSRSLSVWREAAARKAHAGGFHNDQILYPTVDDDDDFDLISNAKSPNLGIEDEYEAGQYVLRHRDGQTQRMVVRPGWSGVEIVVDGVRLLADEIDALRDQIALGAISISTADSEEPPPPPKPAITKQKYTYTQEEEEAKIARRQNRLAAREALEKILLATSPQNRGDVLAEKALSAHVDEDVRRVARALAAEKICGTCSKPIKKKLKSCKCGGSPVLKWGVDVDAYRTEKEAAHDPVAVNFRALNKASKRRQPLLGPDGKPVPRAADLLPPGELKRLDEEKRAAARIKYEGKKRRCTKCGDMKDILTEMGLRIPHNPKTGLPQNAISNPQCGECRCKNR